jgi:hypothetical protein
VTESRSIEALRELPAFPTLNRQDGMTLRDYFAGQAIVGLANTGRNDAGAEHAAEDAYRLADALLRARDSTPVSE